MMENKEVFLKARDLIANPSRWTTHVNARDANGDEVKPHDASAVCWCTIGAVLKVCSDAGINELDAHKHPLFDIMYISIQCMRPGGAVSSFNDYHTHEAVMAWLDQIGKDNGYIV